MSFYLAWSLTKVVGVTVLSSFLLYVILKVFSKAESEDSKIKITAKTRACGFAILWLTIALTAVNVGVRQEELGRSAFNSDSVQSLEKTERNKVDSEYAKKLLKDTLKEKKQ